MTFRGWLLAADRAWYGLATATSRTAHATLDATLADLTAFMLFDEELRATPFVRLLAVDHGVVHDIDLAPHVHLDNGQGRLTFADPAGCTALYVAGDPTDRWLPPARSSVIRRRRPRRSHHVRHRSGRAG
ncbi:hypothetical protein [Nannocystis pusilla]|uniref:hypothetical protein n=1 Tax=Nannocystis pusilla TaxID=889268 RepID=UPI003B7CFAFA